MVRSSVCAFVCVELLPSIHSVHCAHQRIVNIMKLYIESNNIQMDSVKNIDFIHVYIFEPMRVNATRVFTLG